MALTSSPVEQARGTTRGMPVARVAAAVGVVLAIFEAYLLIKWVSGPRFAEVAPGPDPMPGWMKLGIITAQVAIVVAAVVCIYRWVVRPWLDERRLTFDGMLCISAFFASIYDAGSSFSHNWLTYNAFFLNRGNPAAEIPGWQAFSEPGQTVAWPMVFFPAVYIVLFPGLAMVGCAVMRRLRTARPNAPKVVLGLGCFTAIVLIDLLLEGQVFMRLGFYSETGWSFAFLDSPCSHNPLRNIVLFSLVFTLVACLRFFRDDHGLTWVERGTGAKTSNGWKAMTLRFFAVFAATQLILNLGYNVPMIMWTNLEPGAAWHDNMIDNSYLNDHICGSGTPRECPGQQ